MVLKFLALGALAYIAWMSTLTPPTPPSGGVVITPGQPNDWKAWEAANPEIMDRIANIQPYISDYDSHLSNERNWYVDSLGNRRFRGGL